MMNPLDWENSVRRWQSSINTHQKHSVRMENYSGTNVSQTYYHYRADTVDDPPSRQSGPAGQCPFTNNFHMEKAELFDADGKPFDPNQEDHDLSRKLKELRKIKESITCKEGAIACKTVLESSLAAFDEEMERCTLKDRVNVILQQRQSSSFLSKFHKHRMKSSGPSKDEKQQDNHPLKMRVNALMKHRMSPCVSPSNTKHPPPQRNISSPGEESSIDQGFQRFLDVLNKGVDVNLLRRIVNDDVCLDDKDQDEQTDSLFTSKSQYSYDAISLAEGSGNGERSMDPCWQENPHSNLIPDNDGSNEEALSPFRSMTSPDPASGIKYQKEDEDKIKHNEQHKQLQNILTSLGLQLEVEEISKLANRTQERLYGKKADSANAESRPEPDRQPRHSPRPSRSSSSSPSSCSSSSRSSRSSGSSYCGSSRSKASGRSWTSESNISSSRERSSEKATHQDHNRGGGKRLVVGNADEIQFGHQHSYAQNQTCAAPHPGLAFPPLADYSLAQFSQYSTYSSNPYQDAMSSYWTYSQVPAYPSFYPGNHPCTQDQRPQFPIAVLERTRGLPRPVQMAKPLDQRCLKTIHRNPVTSCAGGKRTNRRAKKTKKPQNRKQERAKEKLKQQAVAKAEEKAGGDHQPAAKKEEAANQEEKSNDSTRLRRGSKAKNSKRRKHRLTEEQIKANLRKTLEAFNRKVKHGVNQPVSSLGCQTDEDVLMKL